MCQSTSWNGWCRKIEDGDPGGSGRLHVRFRPVLAPKGRREATAWSSGLPTYWATTISLAEESRQPLRIVQRHMVALDRQQTEPLQFVQGPVQGRPCCRQLSR